MIMRKQIISWGMMLAAAFTLTNCAKEIEGPAQEPETNGYPFEIVASAVSTKTVNDGMATKWVDNDKINLFHAEAGGADYKNDNAFTVADVEAGRFTGELSTALETEKQYDWYAIYPYSDKIATPGERTTGYTYIGHSKGLNQTGYNSTDALDGSNCPFYGVAKSVDASSTPSIDMKHLTSVVAINVTNTTDTPVTITTASLTATESIVGSYYIDITGGTVNYKESEGYVKNTATVNVSGGTALAKDESAILYLAIKPFTAAEETELILSVNGLEKSLVMPNDVEFHAGKIKTLNFKYDRNEDVVESAISVKEFNELTDGETAVLTGRITSISSAYNSQYNNIAFYIQDSNGDEVQIYRMDCTGIEDPANTITVGDEITVRGSKTTYNGKPQMAQGSRCLSHKDGCGSPVIRFSNNIVEIVAEEGASVYYTKDNTDPTETSALYSEPFEITETTTVKAIAVAEGKLTSFVTSRVCEYIEPGADSATDVLTRETTGVSGTTYAEWSGKTVSSSAVYAGQSAGDKESIQLRSKNNNSGIITTASGGNLKKIVVNWHNDTQDGRTLQVYGKSSAYTAATDLYDNEKQGELIGTIVKGTSTELDVDGNYQYVGLRSESSAMYLIDISITWDTTGEGGGETPTAQPRNLKFSASTATATMGQSFTAPTLSGATAGVAYSSSEETVATVDAESGAVTLVGAGTTTITASAPATAEYEAGEASYELTVSAAVVDNTDYSGTYAIVAYRTSESLYYYLTNVETTTSTKRLTAVAAGNALPEEGVTVNGDKLWKVAKSGSIYTVQSVASSKYVAWVSGNSAIMSDEGIVFTLEENEGTFHFVYTGSEKARYLSLNTTKGNDYFAMYEGTISDLYLIKAVEGEEAVPELTGITVNATKTTFTVGDTFSFAGTVTANYSNGTTKDVTASASFSGYNMSQEGTQIVTVTYEGKTATYNITVDPAQSGGEDVSTDPVTISTTMTDIVSKNSYTISSGNTATCYTSIALDNIITMSTSGKANCGSFWGADTQEWRLYQNKNGDVTISASSGYIIKSVKFTFKNSNSGTLNNGSTKLSSNTKYDVNSSSVTYTVGNSGTATNGQIKISEVEVVYQAQ